MARDPFALPIVPPAPASFRPNLAALDLGLGNIRTVLGEVDGFGPTWLNFMGGAPAASRHVLRCYRGAAAPETLDYVDGVGLGARVHLAAPTIIERQERGTAFLTVLLYGAGVTGDLATATSYALGQVRPAKMLASAVRHAELLAQLRAQGIGGERALSEVAAATGDSINTVRANRARIDAGKPMDPVASWFIGGREVEIARGIAYGLSSSPGSDDLHWALYLLLAGLASRGRREVAPEVAHAVALALGALGPDGAPNDRLVLAGVAATVERYSFIEMCLADAIDDLDLRTDFDRAHFPLDPATDDRWRKLPFYPYAKGAFVKRLTPKISGPSPA